MINVATCDVTELDLRECESVEGGNDWTYAIGYTLGVMTSHLDIAISNALDYYFGP